MKIQTISPSIYAMEKYRTCDSSDYFNQGYQRLNNLTNYDDSENYDKYDEEEDFCPEIPLCNVPPEYFVSPWRKLP